MKYQIRRGVFETNSSSVHSLTMCDKSEFDSWVKGDVYFLKGCYELDRFLTREEAEALIKESNCEWNNEDVFDAIRRDFEIYEYEEYGDYMYTFNYEHTTANGDNVVAFGYYGND